MSTARPERRRHSSSSSAGTARVAIDEMPVKGVVMGRLLSRPAMPSLSMAHPMHIQAHRLGHRLVQGRRGFLADRFGLAATLCFLAGTIVVANLFILLMPRKPARAGGAEPRSVEVDGGPHAASLG
ncbi:MAG: hypothetical protein C0505_18925 [Leptothrix sp. (in: Bacteria)]|nr:hypothetical protein [Leptothrix sp. (in: b-proteobacteria)]